MDLIIHEATVNDAAQMLQFVQNLSEEPDINLPMAPGEFKISLEQEKDILAEYQLADNSTFLVAEVEGEIVGILNIKGGLRSRQRHAGELGISVKKGWRGKGLGEQLMEAALRWARAGGILKRIELKVYARNTAAIHLYQKYGFEIEGTRRRAIFQGGQYLDDLIMSLLLE